MTTARIPLTGYANRLSARPGDTIEFKISSQFDEPFQADLIRIVCADPNPAGPGLIEHQVDKNQAPNFGGHFDSISQPFYPGSYGSIQLSKPYSLNKEYTCLLNIWPTLAEKEQCIFALGHNSGDAIKLSVTPLGCLRLTIITSISITQLELDSPLDTHRWHRIFFSQDDHLATLGMMSFDTHQMATVTRQLTASPATIDHITIAGDGTNPTNDHSPHFNGKIESPMIFNRCLSEDQLDNNFSSNPSIPQPIFHWDFCQGISGNQIFDQGPLKQHGLLVNAPARAMTGSNWDGSEMSWRHAPDQYGAIHFHDDDIYDFNWLTSFKFIVPDTLPSGIYAARIRCCGEEDKIPFFICPPKGESTARLCVLVSTFTYTVYGNHARPDFKPNWLSRNEQWDAYPWNPAVNKEYGLSTYNYHSDGSGICHGSAKRPLFNLRPGYVTFGASENGCSGLRHFQADSHLITWLEHNHIDYDIITDWELHHDGIAAIAPYNALTTGTHPEYHTRETLDALTQYRNQGGNFMYLGGNGFYWKIALNQTDPSLIEIRRGEGGIRAWAAAAGEYYHAFDGEYGGLWRRNGRPPQKLAGVGFSAQGQFYGSYYRRGRPTRDGEWIFSGIEDEVLGDFGLSGGGAAGFELDRIDYRLGSDQAIQILASSENHDNTFVLVPEEHLTHITNLPNEPVEKLLRADMIYQRLDNGGQLFATGSITFCGSLLHNKGDNNISKLLYNIVQAFI